ncbi:hypothetical protein R6Q59_006170 [Mikania micrantha]
MNIVSAWTKKGKKVGYELVFIDTHATKETKKRLREGEININDFDELEFVTTRSKESFVVFHKELEKEYMLNNNENIKRDEYAVWERLHPNSYGRIFVVGSSLNEMNLLCGYVYIPIVMAGYSR